MGSKESALVNNLKSLRADFERLRDLSGLVTARLTHIASNAEAMGLRELPPHPHHTLSLLPCGSRAFEHVTDENGKPIPIDPPILNNTGRPVVDHHGRGIKYIPAAYRQVEFFGTNIQLAGRLRAVGERATNALVNAQYHDRQSALDGWTFNTHDSLWWPALFESVWEGDLPLVKSIKHTWIGREGKKGLLLVRYDVEEIRRLSQFPALDVPSFWSERPPEAYFSDIEDVPSACCDFCEFLISQYEGSETSRNDPLNSIVVEPEDDAEYLLGSGLNTPSLSKSEILVINALATFDAVVLPSADAIADAMQGTERRSPRTITPTVRKLIELGLAERPNGPRKGTRLTILGRKIASKIAS